MINKAEYQIKADKALVRLGVKNEITTEEQFIRMKLSKTELSNIIGLLQSAKNELGE